MTLIKKISMSSRNGEVSALLNLILMVFAKLDWSFDLYLTPMIVKLGAINTAFVEALNRLKVYSQMAEKDNERDLAIRSLFKLVEGYMHIPVADLKQAANKVYDVLEQYGLSLQHEDYNVESAGIESLLIDLNKPAILTDIAKLQGVSESIAVLNTVQKEFDNLGLQQAESEGAKKNLTSASKLKKEVVRELNDNLVGYMNTMAKVNPATYDVPAKTIAELIDKNNELIKRRSKIGEINANEV